MEGVISGSALIHAATLVVSALIFVGKLVGRFIFIEDILYYIMVLFLLGSFHISLYAIFQNDVKKTSACSTVSQIALIGVPLFLYDGYMFTHILVHAVYKSTLFLLYGALLHTGLEQSRDNRVSMVFNSSIC